MATFGRVFPPTTDLKGTELILDADADTTITADTDDRIDIKIAGADDFKFTANNFNVLSGSTLTIDSGATITNSGTANNFGTDPESAYAGVLQTNANFVDQVIFGPSVDGKSWNGLWDKKNSDGTTLFSSLMLATIEDTGTATELNIWDLTEQSAGVISTDNIVDISSGTSLANAATPTSIAAAMGYLIVSSEDGFAIIDPHSGAWAERTTGWPRTLSSSTVPALVNNDVQDVAAGFSDQPAYDPRTGGPHPTFAVSYGTGAAVASVIKDDGNVFDFSGTISSGEGGVGFDGGQVIALTAAGSQVSYSPRIATVTADTTITGNISIQSNANQSLGAGNGFSVQNGFMAEADTNGLTFVHLNYQKEVGGSDDLTLHSLVTRAYNTGYFTRDIRGAWLSNSKTVDRSFKANTLTENGTVTEAVVETSAELNGYSGFSASNNLTRASDADWDVITTGEAYLSGWFKSTGNSGNEDLFGFGKSDDSITFFVRLNTSGVITGYERGATAADRTVASTQTYDDSVWHKIDFVRNSSTDRALYIDGVLIAESTDDGGSLSSSGNLPFAIGVNYDGSAVPAATSTISLVHLSATAPTATQVRQMYDAEKGMFVASAECLLQSGSTDAVIDVDIDPLTNKVIVTQTDDITVWDGLVVDSEPTVNSGASEKGKLWGDLRAEQNSANAYVTAPATDQRQVNEMVRGLASDLPAGVDLSKAKAWIMQSSNTSTPIIQASLNIKSITRDDTGQYTVTFGVPFKSDDLGSGGASKVGWAGFFTGHVYMTGGIYVANADSARTHAKVYTKHNDNTMYDTSFSCVFFGELENE